jgi:K+-sensing histidine kinase KdpD
MPVAQSRQAKLAAELDEAATRLNRLVRNLLDLSRLEAGHVHRILIGTTCATSSTLR